MRAHLFLSSLFLVSLVSTAALAEKPRRESRDRVHQVREPRTREAVRNRGDVDRDRSRAVATPRVKVTERATPAKIRERARGCATEDGSSCDRSSRTAPAGAKDKAKQRSAADQARSKAMWEKIRRSVCEKKATTCADNL